MTEPHPLPDAFTYRLIEGLVKRWTKVVVPRSGRHRRPAGFIDRDLHVRVAAVHEIAEGVRTFSFVRRDGVALFPEWDPGAHVDVVLPSGTMRQYSLNSDPNDLTYYRIGVRAIPHGGGGSLEMHRLEVGDEVVLKGPRNAFPFITASGYLFVAGGIGITPILPMLRDVVARGLPWTFVYVGRTRASMPFLDELAAITAGHEDRVHIWPDEDYGIPSADKILEVAPDGAALYCCGPMPLIESIRAAIPADNIDTLHYERFSPPPVRGGEPFRLILARSGTSVDVAADESALAALRRVRPGTAYSCQQGFCGTCHVRVLAGQVDHRDNALTEARREHEMMVCVSRGTGEITVDL